MNSHDEVETAGHKMDVVIEKTVPEDLPAIMELLKLANMHYIGSPEMPALTYENYFVARLAGEVVGFCGYKILSPVQAKTELMVVHPDYRGRGIGYKLQVRRMEDMLARGVSTLITNTDLPETIEWYKRHFGYRMVGSLKKIHEFGNPDINQWTTLQVDLVEWDNNQRRKRANE